MQQTANYQLNQWDGEDRIMRVDFNSDNAKIDAALEKNAAALSQASGEGKGTPIMVKALRSMDMGVYDIITYPYACFHHSRRDSRQQERACVRPGIRAYRPELR